MRRASSPSRPIAIGSRNWLFAGSPRGGRAARESCEGGERPLHETVLLRLDSVEPEQPYFLRHAGRQLHDPVKSVEDAVRPNLLSYVHTIWGKPLCFLGALGASIDRNTDDSFGEGDTRTPAEPIQDSVEQHTVQTSIVAERPAAGQLPLRTRSLIFRM